MSLVTPIWVLSCLVRTGLGPSIKGNIFFVRLISLGVWVLPFFRGSKCWLLCMFQWLWPLACRTTSTSSFLYLPPELAMHIVMEPVLQTTLTHIMWEILCPFAPLHIRFRFAYRLSVAKQFPIDFKIIKLSVGFGNCNISREGSRLKKDAAESAFGMAS